MDKGVVLAFNPRTQRMAVAVDGDHCALFEMAIDQSVLVGHRLRGDLESGQCFALENLTTGEVLSVIPQGTHLSFTAAQRAVDQT